MLLLATLTATMPVASAEPTSPPPPGRIVVPWGNAPRFCVDGEPGGRSPYTGALWGVAWSPVSERWVETPVCTYRWGYISLSPSGAVADSGQSVTFAMSDSVAAPYIPQVGGASWSGVPAGSVLSGCGSFDISCTFRVERSIDNRFEWQYRIVGLNAPASFVTSPIAADGWRHCSEATPCPYLSTNVWAAVAIPPEGDEPPVPNITAAPTGAEGEWRLDASATWVAPGTAIDQWEWTIPGVGTRAGQVINEVIPREQLPATVRLEVTTTSGRTVSTTTTVDNGISIRALDVEPEPVVAGADPATATLRVRN